MIRRWLEGLGFDGFVLRSGVVLAAGWLASLVAAVVRPISEPTAIVAAAAGCVAFAGSLAFSAAWVWAEVSGRDRDEKHVGQ